MAKASRPGLTKTRLSPPLTPAEAADLNTVFLKDVVETIGLAAAQTSLAGYMAYGPPGASAFFDFLPPGFGRFEAWAPAFERSLVHSIETLLDLGHVGACLLNADSPTLPPTVLVEAAETLTAPGDRVVLGPSTDGGYYLIGLTRRHARLFEEIDWSTDIVLRQTLDRAAEIGLAVHLLPEWYDVDDRDSLARLRGELFDDPPSGSTNPPRPPARHTRAFLPTLPLQGLESSTARPTG